MAFEDGVTSKNYIDALLGVCAFEAWETIPTPPYYSIPAEILRDKRAESLSILTQFFLANLNVYCKARGISSQNFGTILDASEALSNELVGVVAKALSEAEDVEMAICLFCNANALQFGLSQALELKDIESVRKKFERTYRTITATKENPHMDDFMILDTEATGNAAKFVMHQGAICVNFAEIVDAAAAFNDAAYFERIRADFAIHPAEISPKNECVAGFIEVEIQTLLTHINEEQFRILPSAAKDACRAHPCFQLRPFLNHVARGEQKEAEALLVAKPDNTQILLRTPAVFTDYSGRTFNCTGYEYAYWAKDVHMCRALESYMDCDTKAHLLARIDEMERIDAATALAVGLTYRQHGREHRSAHFDLTPLKEALQRFIEGCSSSEDKNSTALRGFWWDVGTAQRDTPAHVAQEYCRPDRSFYPTPVFNDATLPRELAFQDYTDESIDTWFPLPHSFTSRGLGYEFSLIRGDYDDMPHSLRRGGQSAVRSVEFDLAAVKRLDEVRTADLKLLREYLKRPLSAAETLLSMPM